MPHPGTHNDVPVGPRRPAVHRQIALLLLCVLLLAACSGGQEQDTGSGARSSPTPGATPGATDLSGLQVRLEEVATLDRPLALEAPPGSSDLYIAEQGGLVRVLRGGVLDPQPVLDLTGETVADGERGLLGLAISPDQRWLYVNLTNRAGNTRILEFAFRNGEVDPETRRQVLAVSQPFANHNGGHLAFGPDNYLYIGLGDGGSSGDPQGNGQNLDTLLGKLLRIDPRPHEELSYRVPEDNPFVRRDNARDEIWASGLRNPWRFSFDPAGGDLWIADVGQNEVEEVNVQSGGSNGGENYGWNLREGTREFAGGSADDLVDPVIEYPHEDGACSVTGGVVYRGEELPALRGSYLYGDFCAGWVRAQPVGNGRPTGDPVTLPLEVPGLSSFALDQRGELYVLSLNGSVSRLVPA